MINRQRDRERVAEKDRRGNEGATHNHPHSQYVLKSRKKNNLDGREKKVIVAE